LQLISSNRCRLIKCKVIERVVPQQNVFNFKMKKRNVSAQDVLMTGYLLWRTFCCEKCCVQTRYLTP